MLIILTNNTKIGINNFITKITLRIYSGDKFVANQIDEKKVNFVYNTLQAQHLL